MAEAKDEDNSWISVIKDDGPVVKKNEFNSNNYKLDEYKKESFINL